VIFSCRSPKILEGNLSVTVTNTSSAAGSEVVQLYVVLPTTGLMHKGFQLKGLVKVPNLAPERKETVKITLNKYVVSYCTELYKT
jgi:beta-glucosidase